MNIFHRLLILLYMALPIAVQGGYQQEQLKPEVEVPQPAWQDEQAIGHLNQEWKSDSLQVATGPGDLDTTFAETGKTRVGFGFGRDFADAVAAQPDGKVVVVGVAGMVDGVIFGPDDGEFGVIRYNPDGSLDTSFGSGGKVRTLIRGCCGVNRAKAVRIQADGKIVVVGEAGGDFALVRYNSDGSLDPTFDGDGMVTTPVGIGESRAAAMALQANGKIVVAGSAQNSQFYFEFAVVRYNADGSLDMSFNGDGKITTPVGAFGALGNALAMQADGKIVVAGRSYNGSNNDYAVVRYTAGGALDNSFGSGGTVTTPITIDDYANAVAIQRGNGVTTPDKIVVAGFSDGTSPRRAFSLVRYNLNGSLDTSFGMGGKVLTSFDASNSRGLDAGNAVAVQGSRFQPRKIIVAGYSFDGTHEAFAVVRYNADGSLDTSFNGTGKVRTPIGAGESSGNAVKLQTDGKIVVAGISHNAAYTSSDFAVVRYNADGSLDTSFGIGGIVTTPIGTNFDAGYAMAIQTDGKILVAGASSNASGKADFAVVMYNPDGSLDTSYGSGGKVVVDLSDGGDDVAYGVALDSLGRAVVVGESAHLFGVVRLTANSRVAQNVSTQPTNQTARAGASANFSVTDINPSYQWRKDGTNLTNDGNFSGATSDFQNPLNKSLVDVLMRNEQGGAIAVWASSGMAHPGEQAAMNHQLYRSLFGKAALTLGEHITFAK